MRQMTALLEDIKNSRRGIASSNAAANSLYPVSFAGVDGAGPVARGSCKQQKPVNKTSDTENITSPTQAIADIRHQAHHIGHQTHGSTVKIRSNRAAMQTSIGPQILPRTRKISTSHSVSGGQVQAQEDECFTWVVSFVKDYNPLERWTSNSLTAQNQKAHTTHIRYCKCWISTVTGFENKERGKDLLSRIPMIMSAAYPTAMIHSDDQPPVQVQNKQSKQNLGWPSCPHLCR